MKRSRPVVWLLALAAAGCSGRTERADKPPAGVTASAAAPASRLCSLFTAKEIEQMLGPPVGAGMVAGESGTACQWNGMAGGSAVSARIQVINDTRYWDKPSEADGYEVVIGVGREAFVVPEPGGWRAAALTDTSVVIVAVNGGKSDRGIAVKFYATSPVG